MKNIVRILMLSLLCILGFIPTFAIHTYDAHSFIVQGLSNQKNMPSTLQQSVFLLISPQMMHHVSLMALKKHCLSSVFLFL